MSNLFLESGIFYSDVLPTLRQSPPLDAMEEEPERWDRKQSPLAWLGSLSV